jgi:hypothetical protein
MRVRNFVLALAAVAALQTASAASDEERLRIDVYPRFSPAPAAVRVRATVPPDDKNRTLQFVADAPGGLYRSSLVMLDGSNAAAVNEMTLKNLPAGTYAVTVILTDIDGREVSKSREVVVTGSFGSL